jgi:polar amino acid transport system substrate-binding protein
LRFLPPAAQGLRRGGAERPGGVRPLTRLVGFVLSAFLAVGQARAADIVAISQIQGDSLSIRGFEIVREAYRRVGRDAVADIRPNERGILSANDGDTDGDTMRVAGMEGKYPNLVRVAEPVMVFKTVAFTSGLTFEVKGWESLRPYSLCIVRGFKLGESRTDGMLREQPTTNEAALRMLQAGNCQVAPVGEALWLLIDQLNLGPFQALEPPVESTPLYHYVNIRHAGLVPPLTEALAAMRRDGTIDRILSADRAEIAAAKARHSFRD